MAGSLPTGHYRASQIAPSSRVTAAHAAAEEHGTELHRAQQQALYLISSYRGPHEPNSSQVSTAPAAAEEREAELRRAMRDGETRLRERLGQLEADNISLRRWVCRCGAIAGDAWQQAIPEHRRRPQALPCLCIQVGVCTFTLHAVQGSRAGRSFAVCLLRPTWPPCKGGWAA